RTPWPARPAAEIRPDCASKRRAFPLATGRSRTTARSRRGTDRGAYSALPVFSWAPGRLPRSSQRPSGPVPASSPDADTAHRQPDVLDVGDATGELLWNITAGNALADPPKLGGWLWLHLRGGLAFQIDTSREIPVRRGHAARRADDAVAGLQVGRRDAELRRR